MSLPAELQKWCDDHASELTGKFINQAGHVVTAGALYESGVNALFDKLCEEPVEPPEYPEHFAWNDDSDDNASWCDGAEVDQLILNFRAREAALLAQLKERDEWIDNREAGWKAKVKELEERLVRKPVFNSAAEYFASIEEETK